MLKNRKPTAPILLSIFFLLLYFPSSSAVDLLFNGFHPSDLFLFGDSTLESIHHRYSYLSLTNTSAFSLGRALLPYKIPAKSSSGSALPFSSSFLFSMAPVPSALPGHGLTFLFAPAAGTAGAASSQHLGLFNLTTNGDPNGHTFAIEFDVFENQEFHDPNANHVGVDVNSLTSISTSAAGFWPDDGGDFVELTLNDGSNYQAWVDYSAGRLNVTMARAGRRKPTRPLISVEIDLSKIFLDNMYVGFCAATGKLIQRHRILAWSFSNSNFSAGDGLITSNLPDFRPPKAGSGKKTTIAVVAAAVVSAIGVLGIAVGFVWNRRRRRRRSDGDEEDSSIAAAKEEWEMEYWPHRIRYREIAVATGGFLDSNLIGSGGNGRVYKGDLGEAAVAIKLFLRNNEEDTKQFLAEVSTLGRLKHRNLVGLKGWCRDRGGSGDRMLLVYEYMENGSLDRRIYEDATEPLDWGARVRILRDVAAGVLYLHEGWGDGAVLHRDIKASNVMLDRDWTGRLGDFGLARAHPRGEALGTTRVVGSVGYMAPELVRSGRASAATDVYGYGVLVLEVVCGRRPVEEGRAPLVGWAREVAGKGDAWRAVDPRVAEMAGFDAGEAERVVRLGLACTCDEACGRPSMREAVWVLEGMDGVDEGREGADIGLLDAKLRGMGSDKILWLGGGGGAHRKKGRARVERHLTFEELRESMSTTSSMGSTSASPCESDVIAEGR